MKYLYYNMSRSAALPHSGPLSLEYRTDNMLASYLLKKYLYESCIKYKQCRNCLTFSPPSALTITLLSLQLTIISQQIFRQEKRVYLACNVLRGLNIPQIMKFLGGLTIFKLRYRQSRPSLVNPEIDFSRLHLNSASFENEDCEGLVQ